MCFNLVILIVRSLFLFFSQLIFVLTFTCLVPLCQIQNGYLINEEADFISMVGPLSYLQRRLKVSTAVFNFSGLSDNGTYSLVLSPIQASKSIIYKSHNTDLGNHLRWLITDTIRRMMFSGLLGHFSPYNLPSW